MRAKRLTEGGIDFLRHAQGGARLPRRASQACRGTPRLPCLQRDRRNNRLQRPAGPIDIGDRSDELDRDRLLYYRCFYPIEPLAVGIQQLLPCFGPVIEGEEQVQGALDLCWLAKPLESGG